MKRCFSRQALIRPLEDCMNDCRSSPTIFSSADSEDEHVLWENSNHFRRAINRVRSTGKRAVCRDAGNRHGVFYAQRGRLLERETGRACTDRGTPAPSESRTSGPGGAEATGGRADARRGRPVALEWLHSRMVACAE